MENKKKQPENPDVEKGVYDFLGCLTTAVAVAIGTIAIAVLLILYGHH